MRGVSVTKQGRFASEETRASEIKIHFKEKVEVFVDYNSEYI